MSAELEKILGPDLLAALDERMRRIAADTIATREAQAKPDVDEELTVKDVMRLKRVSRSTVYDWVDKGKITHHKTPGGQLRFYRRHVEAVLSVA